LERLKKEFWTINAHLSPALFLGMGIEGTDEHKYIKLFLKERSGI